MRLSVSDTCHFLLHLAVADNILQNSGEWQLGEWLIWGKPQPQGFHYCATQMEITFCRQRSPELLFLQPPWRRLPDQLGWQPKKTQWEQKFDVGWELRVLSTWNVVLDHQTSLLTQTHGHSSLVLLKIQGGKLCVLNSIVFFFLKSILFLAFVFFVLEKHKSPSTVLINKNLNSLIKFQNQNKRLSGKSFSSKLVTNHL